MKVRQKGIVFLRMSTMIAMMLVAILAAAATAQDRESTGPTSPPAPRPAARAKSPALRLMSVDEGLAVLSAALESRANSDSESDCSHLVQAIYERAGFSYPYASSSSLYAGNARFERVARPQPGDLVVWPGHVGIAVNPTQRSFFSALRAGLGVEPYDSPYWKERGRPRFLRYVTGAAATNRVASSGRAGNLKTAASTGAQLSISRSLTFDTDAHVIDEPRTQADAARSLAIAPVPVSVATVHSVRPAAAEVTEALEPVLSENGNGLRGFDMLSPAKPLMIFDQLTVDRVHLQRDRGWAEVRIAGALKLSKQKTNSTRHNEHQRWLLARRDHETWEITIPSAAIYIQSDVAVRSLAHQLAALTDDTSGVPGTAGEKLQLSRLLNVVLEKQPNHEARP